MTRSPGVALADAYMTMWGRYDDAAAPGGARRFPTGVYAQSILGINAYTTLVEERVFSSAEYVLSRCRALAIRSILWKAGVGSTSCWARTVIGYSEYPSFVSRTGAKTWWHWHGNFSAIHFR